MEVDSGARLSIDVGLIRNVVEGDGKPPKKGSPSPRTKTKPKNSKASSSKSGVDPKVSFSFLVRDAESLTCGSGK